MGVSVVASLPFPGNVVLDVDGCLTLGGKPVPGATEAILAIRAAGARCIIATNNSTRTPGAVADALGDLLGVSLDGDAVVTSGMAAATLLGTEHRPAFVVGEEGLTATLEAGGITTTSDSTAARSVVVGLHRGFDYAVLARAGRAAAAGALLVATNDDATFPDPGGDLPGAGALVAAVEAASGHTALVAGKPHRPMLDCVLRLLAPGPTWMVGDRAETDVAFARLAGWTAVLTLSGVTRRPEDLPADLRPDISVPSIADLPRLLAR